MSESSYGESPSYSNSSSSRPSGESNSGESPSSSFSSSREAKPDYEKIKKVLLGIEQVVTQNFTSDEKKVFLTEYRKIIVENEKQIVTMPNASFFLNHFNKNENLDRTIKSKIIQGLNQCIEDDKTKNSQLKYW